MKSLYNSYYKLGLEHIVNRHLLGLEKPTFKMDVLYLVLIMLMILIGSLF